MCEVCRIVRKSVDLMDNGSATLQAQIRQFDQTVDAIQKLSPMLWKW